jgi:hypothetical protein
MAQDATMNSVSLWLPKDTPPEDAAILQAAADCDEGSRRKVRALLARKPELANAVATLARQAERRIVRSASAQVLSQEIIRAQLKAQRALLAEPKDGELERMLVESASLAWLALSHAENLRAERWSESLTTEAVDFWDRHVAKLRSDFLRTCKTLATVRRLHGPSVQVNIAEKQVNVVGAQSHTG